MILTCLSHSVPSEIILKEAADGRWECTISIRYIRDASGTRLGKPRTEQFGSVMTNPTEVKVRMAHAQLACLNPSRPCSQFLNGPPSLRFVSENSFSDNCVVAEIRGPGVPNLSLCDLPGTGLAYVCILQSLTVCTRIDCQCGEGR